MRNFSNVRRTASVLRHAIARFTTPGTSHLSVARSAEALEPRLLFALAAASGGSGLSANLSSNLVIRHQQLICDPAIGTTTITAALDPTTAPVSGAYSVSYNPALVTLFDVQPATGYTVDYNASQIAGNSDSFNGEAPLSSYIGSPGGFTEFGNVDVHFTLTGTPGQQPLSGGFNELQSAGVNGFDTFVVTFALLPGVPDSLPQYTVFFNPAGPGGADFLKESPAAGGQTIVAGGPTPIAPVTVGGPPQGLSVAPDPNNAALNDLFITDYAPASNDNVQVKDAGKSKTGSTGVSVDATLNRVHYNSTFTTNQPFAAVYVLLKNGNDNVQFDNSLTFRTIVNAGDGNDNIQLGNGTNIVTLGKGNDNVQAQDGINTVTAGNGNDNIHLGDGSDIVSLGDGNDHVQLGNASSDNVQLGNGNDNVQLGNGSNQFVAVGNGNDSIQLGDGSNQFVIAGSGIDNIRFGDGSNNFVLLFNGNSKTRVKFGMGTGNSVSNNS
jgi:hypothetical protein